MVGRLIAPYALSRCLAHGADPAGLGRQRRCVRRAQGLAAAAPRGTGRRPLHGRAIDAAEGVQGAIRGRRFTTMTPEEAVPRPADLVNRAFVAAGGV